MITILLWVSIAKAHWVDCSHSYSIYYEPIDIVENEYGIPEDELAEVIVIDNLYLPSLSINNEED